MKLIVGLGNPGIEYEKTRHNIGFMVLDKYARLNNLDFSREKYSGKYFELVINGEKYIFLKPLKYMNLSGEVVSSFVSYFKIDINDILIISDDLDMPVGHIKLKMNSGSGGHNGLKNIEQCLGTNSYKRLKIGISNNKNVDTKNYVLGKFNSDDLVVLDKSIKTAIDIINDFGKMDFNMLMTKYN